MKEKKKIDRREFLKVLGVGAAATTAALYGCKPKGGAAGDTAAVGEVPTDKMTYRTTPSTGDRVSLLGYGCMRWPTRAKSDGSGDESDQQAVNELVGNRPQTASARKILRCHETFQFRPFDP